MQVINRLRHLVVQERPLNWLFIISARFFTTLRSHIFRKLLGSCGKGVVCFGVPTIVGGRQITVGDAVTIGRRVKLYCNSRATIKLGNNVFLGDSVEIRNPGARIDIGDDTTICNYVVIKSSPDAGRIVIGKRVWIGQGSIIEGKDISIGDDVILAPNVHVIGGDHGIARNWRINQQAAKTAPVVIENDVWIGSGSVVLKGVKLHEGCVVGARSVVTHDIPPYTIAVGTPARVIRERK